jgi:phosphohistidine phosphatase
LVSLSQCSEIILYFYTNSKLKTVFIIRHAKSDQSFFGNDFERPLNDRGKTDAPEMAKRLMDKKIKIDALVASPAARAKKTAELFATALQVPVAEIIFVSALYHARSDVFLEVISGMPDELNTVAIFSHNPGITNFVNDLNTSIQIDNMPTCAIFALSANITNWSGFAKAKKEFLFFDYPKNDQSVKIFSK